MSKIVLLAGNDLLTNIVFIFLKSKINIECVIVENPVPKLQFLKTG